MQKFRKIGVLTSGGDAPGMSTCVKAVVNRAVEMGIEVVGVVGGYAGLIKGELIPLDHQWASNVVSHGGTVLYSSRCPEFKTEEGMQAAVDTCRKNGIDALVCIGGDGTFRGATDMTRRGFPSIGLPGTIDNDITATDYTIGLDTAINTTVEMIDKLRDTCESHERLNVVEVMGRDCGQIALYAAIASGAVAVAVPEVQFDEAAAIEKIKTLRAAGKRSMIVVVSEGMFNSDGSPYAETLAKRIAEQTGIDTKFARFAHIVRGGSPMARDRATACEMGVKAVELLVEGKSDLVMCEIDGKITPVDINFALIADRMYKNKLKPGDLDAFTPEQLEDMKALCQKRVDEIRNLYKVAQNVAF
ncbi:MAG: ATP-dependent 6-phosphofructokinase [Clostridia bacterium]|nr:ATP-dependent 6-phosphofructokinase [Clostridia bacterium]